MSRQQEYHDAAQLLIDAGMKGKEAFAQVGEQLGVSPSSVMTGYYRIRKQAGLGRPRKQTSSRSGRAPMRRPKTTVTPPPPVTNGTIAAMMERLLACRIEQDEIIRQIIEHAEQSEAKLEQITAALRQL